MDGVLREDREVWMQQQTHRDVEMKAEAGVIQQPAEQHQLPARTKNWERGKGGKRDSPRGPQREPALPTP